MNITEDKLKAGIQIALGTLGLYTQEAETLLIHHIKALTIPVVSGSSDLDAIMHYDNLIKTELPRTFKELNNHGTHAEFCDKINVVREKAKDNYR